jgi:hypothetical protein
MQKIIQIYSWTWMGSNMEIFEARVLEENLSFWLINHQFWELCLVYATPKTLASNNSMLEPIQDNDNYKPHAKNYSNLFMFTEVIA